MQAERFFEEERFDEAEQAYREVLERVPNHPQALLRLGELAEKRGADPALVSDDEGPVPADPEQSQHDARELLGIDELELSGSGDISVGTEPELEQSATGVGIDLGAELQAEFGDDTTAGDESLIEVEPEPADDEGEVLDAATLLEEAEAEASGPPEPEDSFDLAKALDEEDARRSSTGQSGVGFEEVFKAFKKGIQEQIGADEAEAHYDLAIAYKEMGLLEDAVEQLEPVRRSEEHRIDGLSLLATCKLELGRPQEAAGHLAEALAAVDEGDESVVALRYELGRALLEAGKKNQALDAFQKVAALDATFRDVQDCIEELGSG